MQGTRRGRGVGLEVYFKFILSIGLILLSARIGGLLSERYLRQPPVLGELLAGVAISPFALGGFLFNDPIILNFAIIEDAYGVREFNVMEIFSLMAVIVLLFQAGAETNVREFLRMGIGGASIALGGVILPFALGYATMSLLGFGPQAALFIAAVLTATSIGISVRILMDMGRLHTREGTTILVAAVIDDIIGIILLAIVVAVATTGRLDLPALVGLGALGFLVWFAVVLLGVRFHHYISKFLLHPMGGSHEKPLFALIVGFLLAYLMTLVGLHPVIGAYAAGLLFAATEEGKDIAEAIRPVSLFLAPLFFTVLGMQVNLLTLPPILGLVLLLIVVAILGKLVGCYLPARAVSKLDHKGALVVGTGMIPRGEVGLIIAGAGLAAGAITRDLFAAGVFVSIITTLIVPPMLKGLLKRG